MGLPHDAQTGLLWLRSEGAGELRLQMASGATGGMEETEGEARERLEGGEGASENGGKQIRGQLPVATLPPKEGRWLEK